MFGLQKMRSVWILSHSIAMLCVLYFVFFSTLNFGTAIVLELSRFHPNVDIVGPNVDIVGIVGIVLALVSIQHGLLACL